jgi:hypothetical protein
VHSTHSGALLADVGLMVQRHEGGFQKNSRALLLSACSSKKFISTGTQGRVSDCGLVLLREVKLTVFFESCARVALTQDLERRVPPVPMVGWCG